MIFGAYGFLGLHLSRFLELNGSTILKVGTNISSDIYYKHPQDYRKLPHILRMHLPDVIINLIALTDVDRCEEELSHAYSLNTYFPALLKMSALELDRCIHIVHISTDQIYSSYGPHTENEKIKPINIYGITKLFGEYEINSQNSLILRTNFIGKSLSAEKISFSDWIVNSLRSSRRINGYNDIFFSPLHISTLCKCIHHSINCRMTGIYNVGSNVGISKADFILKLCNELKYDNSLIDFISVPTDNKRALRPKDMRLDSSKFHEASNFVLPSTESEIKRLAYDYT